jgi:hypothetical protein
MNLKEFSRLHVSLNLFKDNFFISNE